MKLAGSPRDPKLVVGKGMKQRITKAGIAAEAAFDALVHAYLATVGTKPGRFGYEWRVETVAGAYDCGPRGHMIVGSFVEPARAKALGLPWLNDYSGKWNHHYSIGAGVDELDNFKRQLECILPPKNATCSPALQIEPYLAEAATSAERYRALAAKSDAPETKPAKKTAKRRTK